MKTPQVTTKAIVACALGLAVVVICFKAGGGSLEPNAPPGPTMHTLEDIYQAVASTGEPPPQPMALDGFLKIEGIAGEATDEDHQDWIEVLGLRHGITLDVSGLGGGGGITAQSDHNDVYITKEIDKSSPKLYLACSNGKSIGRVQIQMVKETPAGRQQYMEYVLHDALVTSVRSAAGNEVGSAFPFEEVPFSSRHIEEVSFNYSKIEWTYTQIDENGQPMGDVSAYWDVVANRGS